MISSFAYSLLSIFHEPGKGFETFSIMKDVLLVCFAKDASSLPKKHKWPDLSVCHAGALIESFFRSLSEIIYDAIIIYTFSEVGMLGYQIYAGSCPVYPQTPARGELTRGKSLSSLHS